ncbi:MAG: nucleoside monophosphate kinase [Phycisphaerae bacterium]
MTTPLLLPLVVLLGLPGSGKSTVGRALATLPTYIHVSSGEIFRGMDVESDLGRDIKRRIDAGGLVPDELAVQAWLQHVHGLVSAGVFDPKSQHLLSDGMPRTVAQVQLLQDHVHVSAVLFMDVSDEQELVGRLLERGEQGGRADDRDVHAVRDRIALHRRQVLPVLEAYRPGLCHTVEAGGTPVRTLANAATALAGVF